MPVYRKDVAKADTYVSCPMCSCEITMQNTGSLPREFSVECPNCLARKVYQAASVHDRKPNAETIQSPGKMQFGIKPAINHDPAAAKPMQPKSPLNAMAAWLLQ